MASRYIIKDGDGHCSNETEAASRLNLRSGVASVPIPSLSILSSRNIVCET